MSGLTLCVEAWLRVLPDDGVLVVTVDAASDLDVRRVLDVLPGREDPRLTVRAVAEAAPKRSGVAASKNTGIEALMEAGVEHLFLCDDDTWPLHSQALRKHTGLGVAHSMLCWGKHRFVRKEGNYAIWSWPRGALLYAHRSVIERAGGMREEFGIGGHEHVEWSRRIHACGLTPAPYVSPASYAEAGVGGLAMRASVLWKVGDMPRLGEALGDLRARKARSTTLRQTSAQWELAEEIMRSTEGSDDYVPYSARENGRVSATLWPTSLMSRGAETEETK